MHEVYALNMHRLRIYLYDFCKQAQHYPLGSFPGGDWVVCCKGLNELPQPMPT